MTADSITFHEHAKVTVLEEAPDISTVTPVDSSEETLSWKTHTNLKKFDEQGTLFEEIDIEGNAASVGGISALWHRLVGGTTVSAFDNANAAIGVGDSTTANGSPLTSNDLLAATNKLRKGMDATYPQHTDSTSTDGSRTITFRATFASAEANFAWNEWGVFNAVGAGAGRMLNRKQEALGTKVSGATWQLTLTLTMA